MSDLRFDPYSVMVDFYDAWCASLGDADVDFYVEEAQRVSGPVLELAAGTGRVSIPIARSGQRVIAVDASGPMLTEGGRRAARAGVADRITWVLDDMRTFVADPRVSLVMIPFRSFLHLETVEDQLAALEAIRRSLIPGGRVIVNMFIPDPATMVALHGQRRLQGDFVDERGRRCEIWAISSYRPVEQRIDLRAIMEVYEAGALMDTVEADLRLRMIYRYEMEHLFARAGFDVDAVYGGFDRSPIGEGSTEMIWIARKP